MAVTIKTFESNKLVQWQWPVKVVLANGGEDLRNELQQYYWSQQLSQLKIATKPFAYELCNILIFHKGIKDVIRNRRYIERGLNDVIIIFDALSLNDGRKGKPEGFESEVQRIAEFAGVGGVFVVDPGKNLSDWFERVIIELSHNQNIIAALEISTENGYFLTDPILKEATTLSFVVKRMIHDLGYVFGKLVINSMLTGGYREFTAAELAEFLEKNAPGFKFDHESGEATGIAEISKVVYGQEREDNVREMIDRSADVLGSRGFGYSDVRENKVEESESENPRYLQAQIINEEEGVAVQHLIRGTSYILNAKIDNDLSWTSAKQEFPSSVVFEKSTQSEETLQIVFRSGLEGKPQLAELVLPRTGESTIVSFPFETSNEKEFKGELYAYYKNRLIQKAIIRADVLQDNGDKSAASSFSIKVVFSAVKEMSNLSLRKEFGSSFFYEPRNSPGQVHGMANNKPIDLYLLTDGLEKLVGRIKQDIEDAVIDIDKHPTNLHDPSNVKLLRNLALKGNSLLVNHFGEKNKFEGPVQIVTKRIGFIPIDFIYGLPAPAKAATLCNNAVDALKAGSCMKCYDHSISPAPHICPFGFWTFSRVIERHSTEYREPTGNNPGDYQVVSATDMTQGTLTILNETVHASSIRIESASNGLRGLVSESIKKNSTQLNEADTWEKWTTFTDNKNPDSLILLVHVENDEDTDTDELEIGDGSMLMQNFLDKTKIGNSPPFIIIIGCEVTNTETYGFDISNQLMRNGAAIVLSNFTKIRGRQAGPIVIRLVELLKQNKGNVITFGEVLLKLKQQLLAEGMIASLSLMAHGDADWKIKIPENGFLAYRG